MLVERRFSEVARNYQKQAKVQEIIGSTLLERLDYHHFVPKVVLDLGAGPGHFSLALQKKYPKAKILSLDISFQMLQQAKRRFRRTPGRVQADMCLLPLKENSVDMIFANQSLHWGEEMRSLFTEMARVLKKDGLLLFSTLGPDTFKEIKVAWSDIDTFSHVNHFDDMHDIGDNLLAAGLKDPVVDMDIMTTRYRTVKALCRDLKRQGVSNNHIHRSKGLMSRKRWIQFELNYEKHRDSEDWLPLTYEVVFGQAWGGETQKKTSEVCVPITDIKKMKR